MQTKMKLFLVGIVAMVILSTWLYASQRSNRRRSESQEQVVLLVEDLSTRVEKLEQEYYAFKVALLNQPTAVVKSSSWLIFLLPLFLMAFGLIYWQNMRKIQALQKEMEALRALLEEYKE
ncbi:hypothetical protein [Entomospira culicis]|uniref:Uncharacterized protein n=1 Tax=Entomospira culicis TaxID=2719989 RepID=A0A968GHU9_9SPIO|nr:hypothetical protein [Entomospira culicis]NIZ19039.1 hypothetical protein [Entomospira culicis]NIZ69254.1 hypothetical protein [Entomospira culicis]WDI37837.1 hypothetical protein PVA46_03370 [Entomospira culicis]WDI39465.1 hypothetical protein PVA47_03375 [Entomospira culicis]